jgi:hypothetical protein
VRQEDLPFGELESSLQLILDGDPDNNKLNELDHQ